MSSIGVLGRLSLEIPREKRLKALLEPWRSSTSYVMTLKVGRTHSWALERQKGPSVLVILSSPMAKAESQTDDLISSNERSFIIGSISEEKRVDGRGLFDFRTVRLSFGSTWGRVQVQLGATRYVWNLVMLIYLFAALSKSNNAHKGWNWRNLI
jgi:hypothetical protein